MACGAGKTFVYLRIVEGIAGEGGCLLDIAPRLEIMSKTVRG